ncbi:DUF5412 family protein [Azospirillum sp.]|uniref:DUF5412 family protein n=1 Tax=Azospirillum sp. TaxID=34012 RepID=UPI002D643B80|nr:DUF5412 family protein [Azospirillum sp.]HYF88124.1 DUF5412 family protein [Azospirillum sp.]
MIKKFQINKIILVAVGVFLCVPILIYATFFIYIAFFFDMCRVDNLGETPSPDGKVSVVIYSVDCGATTGFNTRATFAPANRKFDPDGSKQFLYVRGQHDLHVRWIDAATVEITASNAAEAFGEGNVVQRESSMDGVAISYR